MVASLTAWYSKFLDKYKIPSGIIISKLPNLFIGTPRMCNSILLFIVWVRSFIKVLPSVNFFE